MTPADRHDTLAHWLAFDLATTKVARDPLRMLRRMFDAYAEAFRQLGAAFRRSSARTAATRPAIRSGIIHS